MYPDWASAIERLVAGFRQSVGTDTDDPRSIELVGELSLAGPLFRTPWARHDVRTREGAQMRPDHPQLGELRLRREKLAISGTSGQMLVVYHAEAGSPDAEKLRLLGSLSEAPPPAWTELPATPSSPHA